MGLAYDGRAAAQLQGSPFPDVDGPSLEGHHPPRAPQTSWGPGTSILGTFPYLFIG